jgi:hypothetical protein
MELLFMVFYPGLYHFIPLSSQFSSQHRIVKHLKSVFFPSFEIPSFTLHKGASKITILTIIMFMFPDVSHEDKKF